MNISFRSCCIYCWGKFVLIIVTLLSIIMLVPIVLPSIGIGQELALATNDAVLCKPFINSGLSGMVTRYISKLPLIGEILATNTIASSLAAIALILSGRIFSGSNISLSKWIARSLMIIGTILAILTILPAIKQGIIFLALVFALPAYAQIVSDVIGSSGQSMQPVTFITLAGVIVAAHVNCIVLGIITLSSYLLPNEKLR